MSAIVIAMVLLAALLHASWNALQKSAADPAWAKVLYAPASILMLAPLTVFVPFPSAQVWPWLLGGSALHVAYAVLLYWAFEHGELGEIYPISRGASPVMVVTGCQGRGLIPRIPLPRMIFATVFCDTISPSARRSARILGAPLT